MDALLQHLPAMPVVIPLLAAASMLLFGELRRGPRVAIALVATLAQVGCAWALLYMTSDAAPGIWPQGIGVYTIGSWPAPFGIVLVVDRLAALMLVLGSLLALPALLYSLARWDRIGVHYHPLFQLLLMGLNGAFLTGDLFNLFVFFEVLLAASYGLLLHGSGAARVKSGLHYVAVNLVSSLLFLIGVALIYGATGTLNLADLALRAAALASGDRGLFQAGLALLGIAFLIKAGSWPLNFWLPGTYAVAGAPVAALFSIMTKVGVYSVLRIGSLLNEPEASAPLGGPWLFYGGLATIVFGAVGMLAAQQLSRLIAHSVIVSSGTVLAAVGFGATTMTAPALFYLLISVLATGAFFMLNGMTERMRTHVRRPEEDVAAPGVSYEAFDVQEPPDARVPDDEVGIAIPAALAFLGFGFFCCVLLISGLPPLAGFLAKLALVSAALDSAPVAELPSSAWWLVGVLLAAGLAALVALTRIGMRLFWGVTGRTTPRLRIIEAAPVAFLVLVCVALTIGAGPVMSYIHSTADALHAPSTYIDAVLGGPLPDVARTVPAP